jgi:hypothetical protein
LWRANVAATWRATSQSAVTVAARYSGREYNTLTNTDTNPNTYGGTSTYTVVDAKFTFRPTKRTELGSAWITSSTTVITCSIRTRDERFMSKAGSGYDD